MDTSETPIRNKQPRSIHGAPSACLGLLALPVLGAGVALAGVAGGLWSAPDSDPHMPRWVLGSAGATFLLAGLALAAGSARAVMRKSRAARMRIERPREPWLADHPWSGIAATDNTALAAVGSLGAAAGLGLFLTPFNYWAFASGEGPIPVKLIVGLFDAIALFLAGQGLYLAARRLKYGRTTLRFRRFPFFLGDTVEAEFRSCADLRPLKSLRFTLRCVVERLEPAAGDTPQRVVCCQAWAHSWEIPPTREHPVSVPLPHRPELATNLHGYPARYWELVVEGEAPGVDFGAEILVPVYARPPA